MSTLPENILGKIRTKDSAKNNIFEDFSFTLLKRISNSENVQVQRFRAQRLSVAKIKFGVLTFTISHHGGLPPPKKKIPNNKKQLLKVQCKIN